MDSLDTSITTCRLCQHYSPEGRRGGFCEKLDVPVISKWDACSLATHPFETSWQSDQEFNSLFDDSLVPMSEHLESSSLEISEMQDVMARSLSFSER
jgi:hypothetical protein